MRVTAICLQNKRTLRGQKSKRFAFQSDISLFFPQGKLNEIHIKNERNLANSTQKWKKTDRESKKASKRRCAFGVEYFQAHGYLNIGIRR